MPFGSTRVRRILIGAAGVVVLGVIVHRQLRPVPVTVETVSRGPAIEAIYATGTVEPSQSVELKARVGGTVGTQLVEEGDAVKEGQLLGRIDVPSFGTDLRGSEASLRTAVRRADLAPMVLSLRAQTRAAEAELEKARSDRTRAETLVASGSLPSVELERASLKVRGIESQITALQAQQEDVQLALNADAVHSQSSVASLQTRLKDGEIRSPIEGVVLARRVQPGEVVAPNQGILRVGDLRDLRVRAMVDEADIDRVREGQAAAVRFYSFGGRVFPMKVRRIAPAADPERKAFVVELVPDSPIVGLRPGITAEVNVVVQQHDGALLVAADAVHDGKAWVLEADGTVHARRVGVGIRGLTRIEVTSGLLEGDRVAVGDTSVLRDGARAVARAGPENTPAAPAASSVAPASAALRRDP